MDDVTTLDGFANAVLREFIALSRHLSEQECMDYLNSARARDVILYEYEYNIWLYKSRGISLTQFREGSVNTVVAYLYNMY